MIGQPVEGPPSFPIGGIVFGLIGMGLAAVAIFTANLHYAIGALLPFFVSLLLWTARRPAFSAQFTESAIEINRPLLVIPYEELRGLEVEGMKQTPTGETAECFSLQVIHSKGVLEIPSKLNVPSVEVYQFLHERLAPAGPSQINPALDDYLRRQEEAFGTERVWSYGVRRQLGRARTNRRARAVSLAMFLTGLAWVIVAAIGKEFFGWLPVGILLAAFGGIFSLVFWRPRTATGVRIKNWRKASLVISPVGLAMVQGDIQGELRWSEVQNVHLRRRPKGLHLTSDTTMPGIVVSVEGAKILIADIYDQPLAAIYEKILEYWREA